VSAHKTLQAACKCKDASPSGLGKGMPGDTKISTSGARVLRSVHLHKRKQEAKNSQEQPRSQQATVFDRLARATAKPALWRSFSLSIWSEETPDHESLERLFPQILGCVDPNLTFQSRDVGISQAFGKYEVWK
jgi:hypothetical protein